MTALGLRAAPNCRTGQSKARYRTRARSIPVVVVALEWMTCISAKFVKFVQRQIQRSGVRASQQNWSQFHALRKVEIMWESSKKCKKYKNIPTIFVLPSKKEVWRQPKRAILSQKYIGFVSSIFLLGVFTQKTHLQTLWWKSTLSELSRKISQKKVAWT